MALIGVLALAWLTTCFASEGKTPFWNEYAFMFMYPPAFSFTNVAGAVNYRFEATGEGQGKWTFTARSPHASLAPVWDALPVGVVKVVCRGIGSDGRDCGVVGARTFWLKAAFMGDEKSYPPARRSYAETAKMILDYQFGRDETKRIAKGERPTWYRFPTKQLAAIVSAAARRTKLDPAVRDESLAVLRGAADYLLSISAPSNSPLAHFTPTYRADETHPDWKGKTMLIYPADGANALLDAFAATGEAKYLAAAKGACETFVRMQGTDGSWPLVVSLADGRAMTTNRCLTTRHVALFERLFKLTGDKRYRAAGDRAFGYLERGPLATWNWEGQFEDTPPTAPYMNLTKHDACSVAIYLTERYSGDARRVAQARALLRFAEDLFVNWEKPFAGGRVLMPEKGRGYYNHYWDHDKWIMPSVFEQYGCYTPVDASAAKLIRTYLALWRVGHDSEDLAKARVLGNMITRMTDDDGLESTWWNEKDRRKDIWPNCMLACEAALEELAGVCAVTEAMPWPDVAVRCKSNVGIVRKPIRGIVLEHHGTGCGACEREQGMAVTNYQPCAVLPEGWLYLHPRTGSRWADERTVALTDGIIAAVIAHYGLGPDVPIISTGYSMGGMCALVWPIFSKYCANVRAVFANCPVTDFGASYDYVCTLTDAWARYDRKTIEETYPEVKGPAGRDALKVRSPQCLVDRMPDVPYYINQGTADTAVVKETHADVFVPALKAAGRNVTYFISVGSGHCGLSNAIGPKWNDALRRELSKAAPVQQTGAQLHGRLDE